MKCLTRLTPQKYRSPAAHGSGWDFEALYKWPDGLKCIQVPDFIMLSTIKLSSIALTVHSIQTVFGALLVQSVDDLPRGVAYDFIVAGGKADRKLWIWIYRLKKLYRWSWRGSCCISTCRKSKLEDFGYWSGSLVGWPHTYDILLSFCVISRNRDFFASFVPGLLGQLQNTPADWNYTTTPSPNGMLAQYSRARMLGGCSSHSMCRLISITYHWLCHRWDGVYTGIEGRLG